MKGGGEGGMKGGRDDGVRGGREAVLLLQVTPATAKVFETVQVVQSWLGGGVAPGGRERGGASSPSPREGPPPENQSVGGICQGKPLKARSVCVDPRPFDTRIPHPPPLTNPQFKTKSIVFRPLIYLDRLPPKDPRKGPRPENRSFGGVCQNYHTPGSYSSLKITTHPDHISL